MPPGQRRIALSAFVAAGLLALLIGLLSGRVSSTLLLGLPLYLFTAAFLGILHLRKVSVENDKLLDDLDRQLDATRPCSPGPPLHSHLLFGTLNTIISLLHAEPAKAGEVIISLNTLLRLTMDVRNKPLIPLRQELMMARAYLYIQKARNGKHFQVEEDIPPELQSFAIPPLILQPILEHAVKHAANRSSESGICLRAVHRGGSIIFEIETTGNPPAACPKISHTGKKNELAERGRTRLTSAFPGREITFDMLANRHGGATVSMRFPAKTTTDGG